jgi:CubicO group peptidase (beta-lactamase class C family)
MHLKTICTWLTVLLLSLPTIHVSCQTVIPKEHQETIDAFVNGYNAQDFGAMRNSFGGALKLIFSEKMLKQSYTSIYEYMGPATISEVQQRSSSGYHVLLKYQRDPTETMTYQMTLSKKSKIVGFGTRSERFRYNPETPGLNLTKDQLAHKIDSTLAIKNQLAGLTGCVTVVKDKEVIYQNCIGESNREEGSRLNSESVFELASVSKAFTAMGIMILAEQGKLKYDDLIEKYIPGLPYKGITIEHLLWHTSGLPDYIELMEKHWDKSKIATNNDVIAYLKKYKPKRDFKPGKKHEYSNTGYLLLSSIIEAASGMTYNQFLKQNIFEPLGMKHTRVYNTRRTIGERIPNYAYGYVYSDSLKSYVIPDSLPDYDYVTYLDGITGDGLVNSTISDMVLWSNVLREQKLVSPETWQRAIRPYQTKKVKAGEYGYGWQLRLEPEYEHLIYHSGGWPGYITLITHFLDKELSVIVLTNSEYFNTQNLMGKIIQWTR